MTNGGETKHRTLRWVAVAVTLNAYGLPGCDTFDDEPPDSQAAPDGFVGFVTPATAAPAATAPRPVVPIAGPIADPAPTTSVPAGSASAPLVPSTRDTSVPSPTVPPRPRPPRSGEVDPGLDAGAAGTDGMEPVAMAADGAAPVEAGAGTDADDAGRAAGGGDAGGTDDASADAALR